VRQLASTGTVIYVLRNLNSRRFLALDHLTKRFGLPRIRFANDPAVGAQSDRTELSGRSSPVVAPNRPRSFARPSPTVVQRHCS
jgi:hypothetical protein